MKEISIDDLLMVRMELDKISYLIGDVMEEFFHKYDNRDKEQGLSIAWEFSRYGAYVDIIADYVSKIDNMMEKSLAEAKGIQVQEVVA